MTQRGKREARFDVLEDRAGLRDGVVVAVVRDAEGVVRGRVAVDESRTTTCRVTVTSTDAFLDADEVRVLAAALLWAAERSEALG